MYALSLHYFFAAISCTSFNTSSGCSSGFTSGAALYIAPAATNDPVDNVFFSNVDFDTSYYGIQCTQPSGYSADIGQFQFVGAQSQLSVSDGVHLDCAALNDFEAPGMLFFLNGGAGLWADAGTRIKSTGAIFDDNNTANGGANNVTLAGNVSDVNLDGSTYTKGSGSFPVAYNISLGGSVDSFSALNQRFSNAAIGDVNLGSTGTHINISTLSTDQSIPTNITFGGMAFGSALSIGADYKYNTAPTNGLIVEGHVGIDIATPSDALDVNGLASSTFLRVGGISNPGLSFSPTAMIGASTGSSTLEVVSSNAVGNSSQLWFTNTGQRNWTMEANRQQNAFNISADNDANIYFTIGNTGNVGIGTTSPFALLSVAGNGFFLGNLTASNITATGMLTTSGLLSVASSTIGTGTQGGGLTINGGATTTGGAYFGGKVGIGTASPAYNLDVKASTGAVMTRISSVSGSDSALIFEDQSYRAWERVST